VIFLAVLSAKSVLRPLRVQSHLFGASPLPASKALSAHRGRNFKILLSLSIGQTKLKINSRLQCWKLPNVNSPFCRLSKHSAHVLEVEGSIPKSADAIARSAIISEKSIA
jgi:hypothetical protein